MGDRRDGACPSLSLTLAGREEGHWLRARQTAENGEGFVPAS